MKPILQKAITATDAKLSVPASLPSERSGHSCNNFGNRIFRMRGFLRCCVAVAYCDGRVRQGVEKRSPDWRTCRVHARTYALCSTHLPSCALWQITKLHNTPQCTEFWFWPSYGRIGDGGAVVSRGGRCPPGEHRSTKCSSSIPSFCSRFLLNVGGNEWVHCIQREYFSAHPG